MNGSSSVPSASQTIQIKTEPVVDAWSKEDCLTLLERIQSLLPDGDAMKYKTTESHFDWEKVLGEGFIYLILSSGAEVQDYDRAHKIEGKESDFTFNLDLTKILSKKYKELPDKKKQKYITEFQREKESFEKNMARFKEDHPELIEERKKSDLPEKPKTPQQLWYNHEKKTYMKLHPDVSQKELKEALRRQWSQLSDKKRLKWISKALELQKDYAGSMKVYQEAHPDAEEHVKSVLTKAERQLKDKFDGRPTKPPPNGYSLYCAELMVNMKDVPSTERMVLCSKQWKVMTQKEKDMFQKRCEQKKKQYEIDLQRFLESLPEEERDRVMTEEKLGGSRLGIGAAGSPHGAKSPSAKVGLTKLQQRCREAELEHWVHAGLTAKEKRDGKKRTKIPETPKTAEEMWQHSVIGDYLAKYRSDRKKAQSAMESAWKAMEKKEKIPWIKKAADDQKRYEVQYRPVRELLESRMPQSGAGQRKPKFEGEPKKPPVSGYQMFSQELLTNGELNHFSLKERMVEIGKRWHKLSQSHKDKYKKLVEELQIEYKAELEAWVKSLSPQERAVYKEFSTTKRRSTTKARGAQGAKVCLMATVKGKVVGARAAAEVGEGKRAMAYRAKVTPPSRQTASLSHTLTHKHSDFENDDDPSEGSSSSSSEDSSDSDSD
uniref:HMG box domain-containing protein n=1 Tax=Oncorhynchus mykiss TaxID=8022 RepID=A0A8C7TZQ5_ONCMY